MRQPNPAIDPDMAGNEWSESTSADTAAWTYYFCSLMTPLYGGGVHAGEVDKSMPIRPSGLRGQLRFWWRIACGPFPSSQAMFQREVAIWGGLGNKMPVASRVAVRVDRISGLKVEAALNREADRIEPYAVFPARDTHKTREDKKSHQLARAGLEFRLGIRLHPELTEEQCQEVVLALRWWASFGGVGARTRRGLGAVQVKDLNPVTADEVTGRGGQLKLRAVDRSAEMAWKTAIDRLKNFRQGKDVGRNPPSHGSQSPAGRSRWPEPDMIRRQTRRHAPNHAPEHPVTTVYPRAAFGLPIVFHFKDEKRGEPSQQCLVPEGQNRDRMASPLILRPYHDGKGWRPAALLLPGWEAALTVSAGFGEGTCHRVWPSDPTEGQRLARQIKPMAGRGDDPLTAFMDYFEKD